MYGIRRNTRTYIVYESAKRAELDDNDDNNRVSDRGLKPDGRHPPRTEYTYDDRICINAVSGAQKPYIDCVRHTRRTRGFSCRSFSYIKTPFCGFVYTLSYIYPLIFLRLNVSLLDFCTVHTCTLFVYIYILYMYDTYNRVYYLRNIDKNDKPTKHTRTSICRAVKVYT